LPQPSGSDLLFVSGTASIVGHQTLHPGDTLAQLKESVRNIEAVLEHANQRAGRHLWHLQELKGRVYLRNAEDYSLARDHLLSLGLSQFCFVQADICRKDLLVEIEAEGQHAHAG
jgi:enamine deaminase RidA (YjgF/YER057c/UK114 family)